MKKILCILNIFFFTCGGWAQVNTNIRENIIPLRSTRADVEKLATLVEIIGGHSNYVYETETETLTVYFSREKCIWHGWDVKPDTVVSYSVHPKKPIKFDKDRENVGQLSVYVDDATFSHYTNAATGVQYTEDQNDIIKSITYVPTENDSNVRCKGFPKYDPAVSDYPIYNSYKIKNISNWDVGLVGSILFQAEQSAELTGYIFIYGKREEKANLEKLKKKIEYFVYNVHNSTPQKVKIVFGGFRDESVVETILHSKGYPPPIAKPKYPSHIR